MCCSSVVVIILRQDKLSIIFNRVRLNLPLDKQQNAFACIHNVNRIFLKIR